MAKSKAADILPDDDQGKSPIDNLPVAAGKKRRGRPRKEHVVAAVNGAIAKAPGTAATQSGVDALKAAVKTAIEKALARRKPAGPTSRQGIAGLAKQVARSEVASAIRSGISEQGGTVGLERQIAETTTPDEQRDAVATEHGQSHPFWHLLRNR